MTEMTFNITDRRMCGQKRDLVFEEHLPSGTVDKTVECRTLCLFDEVLRTELDDGDYG